MDRGDHSSGNGDRPDDPVVITSGALDRLTTSLTVAHGHVQLIQRRLRTGTAPDGDGLLHVLAQMEHATRAMRTELQVLHATMTRYPRPDGEG